MEQGHHTDGWRLHSCWKENGSNGQGGLWKKLSQFMGVGAKGDERSRALAAGQAMSPTQRACGKMREALLVCLQMGPNPRPGVVRVLRVVPSQRNKNVACRGQAVLLLSQQPPGMVSQPQ